MTSPRSTSGSLPDIELRCDCGRLLARVVSDGLELRCGRCKAVTVLPWRRIEGGERLARAARACGAAVDDDGDGQRAR